MPYRVRKRRRRWCVEVEREDGWERVKCYDDEEKAQALATALRIAVEAREKALPVEYIMPKIAELTGKALRRTLLKLWARGLSESSSLASMATGIPVTLDPEMQETRRMFRQLGDRITEIDDVTRERVRRYVMQGNAEGWSPQKLAQHIMDDPSGAFSRSRARTIARTESAMAYNQGSLAGYRRSGRVTRVRVFDNEGPNSCAACAEANGQIWTLEYAEEHPIEHPNCVRGWAPYVESAYGEGESPTARPVPPNQPPEYGRRLRGEE